MPSHILAVPDTIDWNQAYLAAILEKDRTRVVGLIEEAREKLALRQRQLMREGASGSDEAEAIHDAYYMLHALQTSLLYRDDVAHC